jgi:hypothetical protein
MKKRSVEEIIQALNDASIRYLIAGGLAVVAHGHLRFTSDVDLIVDLDEDNARRAMSALSGLGYKPRAPVAIEDFASSSIRSQWIREKGLVVFSLHSSQHPATEIDLFVESPVDFSHAYRAALRLELSEKVVATFLGYDDLLALKKLAGRPQDLEDMKELEAVKLASEE